MNMMKTIRLMSLAIIIGLTLIPSALQLSHVTKDQPGASLDENRALEGWPKWADVDNNVAAYTAGISGFLNDNFGGRTLAIRVRSKLFRMVGDTSILVVGGRTDGWYFLNEITMWQSYNGRLSFTDQDVDIWLQSVAGLQSAAQAQGSVFAAIIPPDKARIYPENVPAKFKQPSKRRFASALMNDPRSTELGFIDVEPAILRVKAEGLVYSRTDTHWTGRGAYEAYALVMERFNKGGARFPTIKRADTEAAARDDVDGDLVALMGLQGQITESYMDVTSPKLTANFSVKVLEDPAVVHAGWQTRIYENDVDNGTTLVIVGDSFSNALLPFFKHSFDRIVVMHHRTGNFDLEQAISYNPDAVLFAPVERMAVTLRDFAKP